MVETQTDQLKGQPTYAKDQSTMLKVNRPMPKDQPTMQKTQLTMPTRVKSSTDHTCKVRY